MNVQGTTVQISEADATALAERARAGDREAFANLYRHFQRRVFLLCRHLLRSKEEAEDATTEIFLRVQKAMNTYDSTRPFSHWLLRIATHYGIDRWRRNRLERFRFPQDVDLPQTPTSGPAPLSRLLAEEQSAAVRSGLSALPDYYRLPLVLRYYAELSYEQIATELGVKRAQVGVLIFRGKRELRRLLAADQQEKNR